MPQHFLSARSSCAIGALLISVSPLIFAEGASVPDEDPIQTIVITADPFARTVDQLIQPTEVLSGEDLDRKRGATVGETLASELGVSSSDFGRGAGRPVIRGQSGPRLLTLHNGLSSGDASDVSADHGVSISPSDADQIEILKGPATLLYGSGASAGVVNVVDRSLPSSLDPGWRSQLSAVWASNADQNYASGSLDYGFESTQVHFDASWLDAGDYDIAGPANADGSGGRDVLPNSAVETRSGTLGVAQFWDLGSLAASVGTYQTDYGLPNEETAFIELDQQRTNVEARLNRPIEGLESARLRVAINDYEHIEFESPGEVGTRFFNEQNEQRLELAHAPVADSRGVFGVQRTDRDFRAAGEEAFVPSSNTRGVGLFLLERRPTTFGAVELGVRSDQVSVETQETSPRKSKFSPLSVSGGLLFDIGARNHLKVYASRSQRAPVAEELFSFGPHVASGTYDRGDDRLEMETVRNFELGFDRHDEVIDWRVNIFYQHISDFIFQNAVDLGFNADGSGVGTSDGMADRVDEAGDLAADGDFLLLDYQRGDAEFWGAEIELRHTGQWGPVQISSRLFTDRVRGRIVDGDPLPRVTPMRFGGGLHLHQGNWSLSADLIRVGKQDRIAQFETSSDGFSQLSASLDYQVPIPLGSLGVFLRGQNLLDEEARRHTSLVKDVVPMPGLSVVTGFEWRIN